MSTAPKGGGTRETKFLRLLEDWGLQGDMPLHHDVYGAPYVLGDMHLGFSDKWGFSVMFLTRTKAVHMGIDLEWIDLEGKRFRPTRLGALRRYETPGEDALLPHWEEIPKWTLFWSARESLVKLLKIGFRTGRETLGIKESVEENGVVNTYFKNFWTIKALSVRQGNWVLSLALDRDCQLQMDFSRLRKALAGFNNLDRAKLG